eukprot:936116-Amphidinium_carterae.1
MADEGTADRPRHDGQEMLYKPKMLSMADEGTADRPRHDGKEMLYKPREPSKEPSQGQKNWNETNHQGPKH